MPLALAEIAAGLPAAASFAIAGGITAVRDGRRRSALNESLHEIRRPLHALFLAAPSGSEEGGPYESSLRLAAVAVERLDREINGSSVATDTCAVRIGPLVATAIDRWRAYADSAGKSLRLFPCAGAPVLDGSETELAQALDNLIINAIEHGGARIEVRVADLGERVRVTVFDSGDGRRHRPDGRSNNRAARLNGRHRHGHGLRVVSRTAAAHGGDFCLRREGNATRAVVELPLLPKVGDE
jgi:signal transduction histidine kinase